MPATVEINGNHEWEANYTVDLANAIPNSIRTCKISNPPDTCTIESPHLMIYAEVGNYRSCLSLNAYTRGIRGNIPFDSWQQTLLAKPDKHYCIALFSPEPGDYYHDRNPFTTAGFRTPADPNPPAPVQTGYSTGCFAHPTLGYAACVMARNACNAMSNMNWDNDRNTCRPASN